MSMDMRAIVDMANANAKLLDGTTGPIKAMVNSTDLVFAVWQDVVEPNGVGFMIVKGVKRLEAMLKSDARSPFAKPKRMSQTAIPCSCLEQAEALRLMIEEGLFSSRNAKTIKFDGASA